MNIFRAFLPLYFLLCSLVFPQAYSLTGTDLSAPGPIGGTTPSSGAFTSLSATGQLLESAAGAASAPAQYFTGAIFTGGTGTTNFPHIFVQPTGATAATTWSTAGTAFGINAATGFTGNLIDAKLAGASASAFKVTSAGIGTVGGGFTAVTFSATQASGAAITIIGTGGGVQVGSTGYLGFASSASGAGTIDTKLYRNAAGVVEINNGTAGTHRDLIVRNATVGGTGGTAVTLIASATATLDFASTLAATTTDLTIALTGAVVGDVVGYGTPNGSMDANGFYQAWVSATDVVTVRFRNLNTVAAIDPASGTFRVSILRF